MKRRSFLKSTGLVSLPALLGGYQLSAMSSQSMFNLVNGDSDKILVLIDMNGGNDGLASFVPLDQFDNLANARPNLYIPQNQLLTMTDTIGLHPGMSGINNLYDEGKLTLVQGVAYANQNRSHFRSADIWNTGVKAEEYKTTGWLGRYLDSEFPGYPSDYPNEDCPDPFALTLGNSISGTCQGENSNFSVAIINTDFLDGLSTGVEAPLPDDCYGDELGFVVDTVKKSNAYAERVLDAVDAGANTVDYPDTELGKKLKLIAQLVSGGLGTKIFVVQQGGYDTHADQIVEGEPLVGEYNELITELSDAIYAFQQDLEGLNLNERVLGMTFSEFGRKIKSNAAFGTDHGTAAPMMFFGSCLNPGIIGNNPEISDNVDIEEGVAMQYDFKSVYGSVLIDWFGVSESDVQTYLYDDFQHIPIINGCNGVNTRPTAPIINLQVNAFPNPFGNQFTLQLTINESAEVRIDLADVMGKMVKSISNQRLSAGEHAIPIEGYGLSAGVYFARVQIGSVVQTVRVVKQ